MRLRACPSDGSDLPLQELALDPFEAGVLAVARYLFCAEVEPERRTWFVAFSVAGERWGPDIGLPVAFAVAKLVRALHDVRADFAFHDPYGPESRVQATGDEVLMMRMLHHMRRDETADARDAVEALTRGCMDPYVIRSALALAGRFGTGTPVRQPPALRVVS
ncbi:hypothetical protein [Tateyamaria sp. syn59]|uniref:hypothetical protein n=1 Tax=Tateyamaria sp. syn59 TaxID=2576942 RepID=UPI0011BDD2DF|nr:hypothetical protein [Tateyamaria sp. syn59]